MGGLRTSGLGQTALSYPEPLSDGGMTIGVRTDEMTQPETRVVAEYAVSPMYFEVLGIRFLGGRTFRETEYLEADLVEPMPVVVNSALAYSLYGSNAVVGRSFRLDRYGGAEQVSTRALIVGVVADTGSRNVRRSYTPALYHARRPLLRYATVVIRVRGSVSETSKRVRAVVKEVAPGVPIRRLSLLRESVGDRLAEDEALARLSGAAALVAAILAGLGLIATSRQFVTEHTRELGIRSALGATPRALAYCVFRRVATPVGFGIVIGLCGYWVAAQWLSAHVYGLSSLDALTIAAALATLVVLAATMTLAPALDAGRTNPAVVLRKEN
jgi:hypothetical protein